MEVTRFTEANHPEMMHVPLKGEMLREFVRLAQDGAGIGKMGLAKDSPLHGDPQIQALSATIQKIAQALTRSLISEAALDHGIDMKDMEGLIRRAAKHDVSEVDIMATMDRIIKDDPDRPGKAKLVHDEDAIAQMVSAQLMVIFSTCLAVQEHKEKELLAVAAENVEALKLFISQQKFAGHGEGFADGLISSLAEGIVTTEQYLTLIQDRKSPVVDLTEKMALGPDYPRTRQKTGMYTILDHAIVVLLDIEGSTNAGQEEIRQKRTQLLSKVREQLGVPAREID